MFDKEVDYRLAKWILAGMLQDGIIGEIEMRKAWERMAEHCNPPFLEIEDYERKIGDGVIVSGR